MNRISALSSPRSPRGNSGVSSKGLLQADVDFHVPGNHPEGDGGWMFQSAYTPDGRQFITSSANNLDIWDRETGALLAEYYDANTNESFGIRPSLEPQTFAISPDSTRVLVVNGGNEVTVWEWGKGEAQTVDLGERLADLLPELEGQSYRFGADSIAMAPRGNRFVTGSLGGSPPVVWSVDTLEPVAVLDVGDEYLERSVKAIKLTPDGQRVVFTSLSGDLHVHDAASGKRLRSIAAQAQGEVSEGELALTADGKHAWTRSAEQALEKWDLATGEKVLSFELPFGIRSWTLAPDEAYVMLGRTSYLAGDLVGSPVVPASVIMMDARTGESLKTWQVDLTQGRDTDVVQTVAVSPDGKSLLAGYRLGAQLSSPKRL
jgi:WD40 repeat protein